MDYCFWEDVSGKPSAGQVSNVWLAELVRLLVEVCEFHFETLVDGLVLGENLSYGLLELLCSSGWEPVFLVVPHL